MSRWTWTQASVGVLFLFAIVATGVVASTAVRQPPVAVRDAIYRRYAPIEEKPAVPESSVVVPEQANDTLPAPAAIPVGALRQQEGQGLDQSLRSFRVRLSSDGYLVGKLGVIEPSTGRLITSEAITVHFLQQGKIIAEVEPGVDGVFQAKLEPGIYSMVAAGLDGFMAFSTEVLPSTDRRLGDANHVVPYDFGAIQLVKLQEEISALQIDGAVVPPRNFSVLRQLVQLYLPAAAGEGTLPADQPQPPAPQVEEGTPDEDAGPAEAVGNAPNTLLRSRAVPLQADGTLVGRMRRIHAQSGRPVRVRRINIFFIRDGELVAQAPVSENGSFIVRGLRPGVQSMVAAGADGFAAFGVMIADPVDGVSDVPDETGEFKSVSHMRMANKQAAGFLLDVSLLSPADFDILVQIINQYLAGQGLNGLGIGAGFTGLVESPPGMSSNTLAEMLASAGVTAATIGAIAAAIVDNNQQSSQLETSFDPFQETSFDGLNSSPQTGLNPN